MSQINPGITGEKSAAVTLRNTALAMGSGELRVFATPAMIALIEGCCMESVEELLDEGITTVGTNVSVDHLSASPLGAGVVCKSKLTAFDGRRLDFEVEVFDNAGLIGKGTHTRYTVKADSFLKKTYAKLEK